jgi:uncharacterized protein (DUF1499 family)
MRVSLVIIGLGLVGCAGKAPDLPRELTPCPSSPNCVSTRADPADEVHHIAPYTVEDPATAWSTLDTVVLDMPRVEKVDESETTRHYVFTTALMRFKDDVQFELDASDGVIHFRSASRVGRSDLGVNRKRMETIRTALDEALE